MARAPLLPSLLPLLPLVAIAAAVACGPSTDELLPGEWGDPNDPNGAGATGDGVKLAGFAPAPAGMRRMTTFEYGNTMRDLLGQVDVPSDLEADGFDLGFTTIHAMNAPIDDLGADKFDRAALSLAHQVFSDSSRRAPFVGCTPANVSDPCVRTFVSRFGRRVFRRPLANDEIDRYVGVVTTAGNALGDVWAGLEYATATFLESPYFLYLPQVGEPNPAAPGMMRFSNYEMATRLSYFLTGSTPDGDLLDAADRGELITRDGIAKSAARLLASPKADAAALRFFDEHLSLMQLPNLNKDKTAYPTFDPKMGNEMRQEIEMLVKSTALAQNGDLRNLFDSKATFVNGDLAKLYGISGVSGDQFVSAPLPAQRAGLFTTPGVLALFARAYRSAPTIRGHFIMERFFCWEPSGQMPAIDPKALDDMGAHQTMRQKLARIESLQACGSCHNTIDPPGLALEHFDGLGQYRNDDQGLPIDDSGSVLGQPIMGAQGLAAIARTDSRVASCFARQLYRFATGHREGSGEEVVVGDLAGKFQKGNYQVRALMQEIATSDGFRFSAP